MRRLATPAVLLLALVGAAACAPASPGMSGSPAEPTATSPADPGSAAPSPSDTATSAAPAEPVEAEPRVGVQLFQWNWRSVAKECTDVLGPAGYKFVLLSPAQEHVTGEQWWTSYQPVSYKIESKLGTRAEFKAMVEACHGAGVKVVADAVINHMAGVDGGVGSAGTEFKHYTYPGLYGPGDFTYCDTPGGDIQDYKNREEVQTCELSNLADLKTGTPAVRNHIVAYLNDLLSLGVDGFRIDAAKHMPAADVEAIVDALDGDPLIISEVIRGSGEPIQPEEYLDAGAVFAFQFARELSGIIPGGAVKKSLDLTDGQIPSDEAYTFVTNHDTERNGQTLSYKDKDKYWIANLLLLANPYGTPVVFSGYAFTSRDDGAKQADGRVADAACADTAADPRPGDWVCEHRDLVGMVRWASVVGDAPVDNVWSDGYNVAFDRGDRGLVVVNANSTTPLEVTLTTNLPDGGYCDAVTALTCEAPVFQVEDGKVSVTVPTMSAVALDVNLRA